MDSKEYLWSLRTQLTGKVKRDELERVMTYYYEYFKEGGPEKEAQIMEELGSPEELAAQILGQAPAQEPQPQPEENYGYAYDGGMPPRRGGMPLALKIILGFLLFPVVLGLIIAMFSLVAALGGSAIICLAAGVFSAWAGLSMILQSFATTIFFVGSGLLAVGVGLLLLLATIVLGKVFGIGTGRFFRWMFTGRGA